MKDSTLIARPLALNPRFLCASPEYIERFGKPESLDDLSMHECLVLHSMSHWPFEINGEVIPVRVSGAMAANSVSGVREAAAQGMGLAMLTYFDVRDFIDDGRLVEVTLQDATPERLSIWSVFPTRQYVPARVRAFLALLQESLA